MSRHFTLSVDLGKLGSATPPIQLRPGESLASAILSPSEGHSIGSAEVVPDWTPAVEEEQTADRWRAYGQVMKSTSRSIERLSLIGTALRFRCTRPDSGAESDSAARVHVRIEGGRRR
ncbi:MAG: hypothetical protein SW019_25600 [Actinomycetota bacterium]|nr:hypothetical protein [Actinomycetota bacterium]